MKRTMAALTAAFVLASSAAQARDAMEPCEDGNQHATIRDLVAIAAANDPCAELFPSRTVEATSQIVRMGAGARVRTLPVSVVSNGETILVPIYRVTQAGGRVAYVDHGGRRYRDFEDWKRNNRLPRGRMTFPRRGDVGTTCRAEPESRATPGTIDSLSERLGRAADVTAGVGGVAVGVAAIVGTGGAIVPIAGAAFMAWGAYRGGSGLYDRFAHGETLRPWASRDARSQWIQLGASTLGLSSLAASAGAAAVLSSGAREGAELARVAGVIAVGSQVASTVSVANQAHTLASDWPRLSASERAWAASQLIFWAGMTAYGARRAGGISRLYDPSAHAAALVRAHAAPAPIAPTDSGGPSVVAEGRVLVRDAAPVDGVRRSLVVGVVDGQLVPGDQMWDVRISFRPRAQAAAVEATPIAERGPLPGRALFETRPATARVILRPSGDGRTMVMGPTLQDYGFGSGGVVWDGDVVLAPIRKYEILSSADLEGVRVDQLLMSGILEDPGRFTRPIR